MHEFETQLDVGVVLLRLGGRGIRQVDELIIGRIRSEPADVARLVPGQKALDRVAAVLDRLDAELLVKPLRGVVVLLMAWVRLARASVETGTNEPPVHGSPILP